jgi:hypothetical protein
MYYSSYNNTRGLQGQRRGQGTDSEEPHSGAPARGRASALEQWKRPVDGTDVGKVAEGRRRHLAEVAPMRAG